MSSIKSGIAKFSILAIAVAIFGTAFVYAKGWHKFIFAEKLTPTTGAELIPDEAIMTSFISTDIKNWTKLKQFYIPELEKLFSEPMLEIESELIEAEIDYQQDIQPWIGNAIVALIPTTESAEVIQDLDSLGIIGIKDPLGANNFINKVRSQNQAILEKSKYKGLEITKSTDAKGNILHTTLLGNKLAISDKVSVIKMSIDTYRGKPSLIDSAKTKEIFQQKLDLNHSIAQVYFTNYDRLIATGLQDANLPERTREIFQGIQSFSFGIGTEDNKIKFQGLTKLDPQLITQNYKNSPGKVLAKLPKETIAFVSSQGIDDIWAEVVSLASHEPELRKTINGVRQSTKFITGLDLDQDVFSWMNGEFVLGIVPSSQPNIPRLNIGLGGALVLETSDRATAQRTMDQLNNKFQQNFGIYSQKINKGKNDFIQWAVPGSNLVLSSGWLDKNNILLAFGNKDTNSIYDNRKLPLKNNSQFQEIFRSLPKKNLGYFYLDMKTIIKEISPLLLEQDPTLYEEISVLNSILAIGGTTTMIDQETSQIDAIVLLQD